MDTYMLIIFADNKVHFETLDKLAKILNDNDVEINNTAIAEFYLAKTSAPNVELELTDVFEQKVQVKTK